MREGEALRIQMDRLGQVEIVNRKMKEQKREDDFQIQNLTDKLRDATHQNELLNTRCEDNEKLMGKFSEEIRQLEVLIDRKGREHENLDRELKAA